MRYHYRPISIKDRIALSQRFDRRPETMSRMGKVNEFVNAMHIIELSATTRSKRNT